MSASVEVDSGPRARPRPALPSTAAPPVLRRVVRALLFATLAAATALVGRTTGLLDGAAGVLVAGVLVLLVPTSRELPRRVLVAGCLLLGWTQVLWWWPLPVGGLGRVTLGLVLLAGGLAGWVGAARRPGSRARRLLPRLRAPDLVLPLTVAGGAACTGPWLQAKTPTQTLGMLMGGWDNVAHFSMVHMIRRFGVTVDALPPPAPGATWQFASYPQGFHTVAAAVVELLVGPADVGVGTELSAYTRAMALVVIAATVTVVAGFCALPALRRRPLLVAPVAAFVAAVFLLGPGAQALGGGIANFAVACCLVLAAVLVAAATPRVVAPLTLAALGGALVGIATTWVLMLVLALPAVLMLLLPFRRRRWAASDVRMAVSAVLVLVVIGCLARTAAVLSRVQAESPLTIDGGRVPVDVGLVVALSLTIVGACLVLLRRGGHARVVAVLAMPVFGAATAAALAALQVAANGEVTYYGFKFVLGTQIVLLAVVALPLVHLLPVTRRRGVAGGLVCAAASVLVALGLTQVFGLTLSGGAAIGLGAEAQGVRNSERQSKVIADPPSSADLATLVARTALPNRQAFFIDVPSDGKVSSILAAQWFLALTDTWTLDANSVAAATVLNGPRTPAEVAEDILLSRPGSVVVVRGDEVGPLRRDLRRPALASRIVGL